MSTSAQNPEYASTPVIAVAPIPHGHFISLYPYSLISLFSLIYLLVPAGSTDIDSPYTGSLRKNHVLLFSISSSKSQCCYRSGFHTSTVQDYYQRVHYVPISAQCGSQQKMPSSIQLPPKESSKRSLVIVYVAIQSLLY